MNDFYGGRKGEINTKGEKDVFGAILKGSGRAEKATPKRETVTKFLHLLPFRKFVLLRYCENQMLSPVIVTSEIFTQLLMDTELSNIDYL